MSQNQWIILEQCYQIDQKELELLVKIYRETEDIKQFITAVVYEYEAKVDDEIFRIKSNEFFKSRKNKKQLEEGNPNRPLFSEEITKKVIGELINKKK